MRWCSELDLAFMRSPKTFASTLAGALALCLLGCATPFGVKGRTATSGPGAQGPALSTVEEAEAARQRLDYLSLGDDENGRLGLRESLLRFYNGQTREALSRGHLEESYESFIASLTLFEPRDLRDLAAAGQMPRGKGGVDLSGLNRLARDLEVAFRRRGAHGEVITALMVQQTLDPKDAGPQRRYRELAAWLAGGELSSWRAGQRGFATLVQEPPAPLVRDLELAFRAWPAPALLQELTEVYQAEAQSFGLGSRAQSPRDFLGMTLSGRQRNPLASPVLKLASVYLRVSRGPEAIAFIHRLGRLSKEEQARMAELESAFGTNANPLSAVRLAMLMARDPDQMDVSLQVCRDLSQRDRNFLLAALCVGELAVQVDRRGLALRAFERARELQPQDRNIWDKLGHLYQDRLRDLVGEERTTELEGALHEIETYQEQMKKRFPDQPTGLSISAALSEVGRGYYNAGRIPDAIRFLERSIAVEPNAAALEVLGTIELKRGEGGQALATLERARAVDLASKPGDPLIKVYFKARIGRLVAEALDLSSTSPGPGFGSVPGSGSAAEVRRASLRDWEQIVDVEQLIPERRAEAELERGKLFYQLGEREPALGAFRRAVDLVPEEGAGRDQGQIYADTIAYLVQQGELDEALDAYHRALGRARVVEYLKVYCSLWVTELARRSGQPEDPLAMAFLKTVQGGKWYAELARWATGQQSEEELFRRADTVAKKVEANFYAGMRHLRTSAAPQKPSAGEAMLRNVLSSEMMAFFEYEMAANYLRRGAPDAPRLKPGRGKVRPTADRPENHDKPENRDKPRNHDRRPADSI